MGILSFLAPLPHSTRRARLSFTPLPIRPAPMRQLALLLTGLLVGALCAFMAARTLQQRHALPRGLMAVMQHDLGELRRAERERRCNAADLPRRFARIEDLAGEIGAALGSDAHDDPHLADYATALARAGAAARANPPADCPALALHVHAVAEACEACHRDYR